MEYLLYLQERMLVVVGRASFILCIVWYAALLFLLLTQHMTFFDDGVGDLIIICLLSCVVLLQTSLVFMALKHRLKWFYLPIIFITAAMLAFTPRFLHPVSGVDKRMESIKAMIPVPRPVNSSSES